MNGVTVTPSSLTRDGIKGWIEANPPQHLVLLLLPPGRKGAPVALTERIVPRARLLAALQRVADGGVVYSADDQRDGYLAWEGVGKNRRLALTPLGLRVLRPAGG